MSGHYFRSFCIIQRADREKRHREPWILSPVLLMNPLYVPAAETSTVLVFSLSERERVQNGSVTF